MPILFINDSEVKPLFELLESLDDPIMERLAERLFTADLLQTKNGRKPVLQIELGHEYQCTYILNGEHRHLKVWGKDQLDAGAKFFEWISKTQDGVISEVDIKLIE